MPRPLLAALSSLILLFTTTPASAFTPTQLWSRGFGDAFPDDAHSVATDGLGNVFVLGSFQGTVNFGGGDLTSAGMFDIFLAKFSANGTHLWSRSFGSLNDENGYSVAVDAAGSAIITGKFGLTVNFGGVPLMSAGGDDIFVAKYNPNGLHQWSQRFGSATPDNGNAVAVDASGNVIVTGVFTGTVNFGGSNLISAGASDIFFAKFNAGGTHQWSQRFGSTGIDIGESVAADASGNVFLVAAFSETVNFGGSNLISAGVYDAVLAKYNTSGVHQWSQRFGSTGVDIPLSVATDGAGNVVAAGYFNGTVNFGGSNLMSAGSSDIFLAKYNTSGTHQWSQRFGSTGGDIALSIAVDGSANVLLTGWFSLTVNFGGDALQSAGQTDIVLAKYDGSGVHQWSLRLGSFTDDIGYSTAVDGSGNALVAGTFTGTVDFGSGVLSSEGGTDAFVVKFSAISAEPIITSVLDIGNDQGGKVKVRFSRSGYDDALSWRPITTYEAYRRDDAPPASSAWRSPQGLSTQQLLDDGWTQVGSVAAHAHSTYGIDVPTIGDSTIASGQYYSVFFVRAATNTPADYFDSPPDSGYSLDNLAPGAPTNLILAGTQLYWGGSSAADFDYFTVYGGFSTNFATAHVIGYAVSPTRSVLGSTYPYYFVTATDFSGNESLPASTAQPTAVGDGPAHHVLSVTNFPNPFNPTTSVRYTVPSRGNVTIAVYDVHGATVTTLFDGVRDAGAYSIEWDGHAEGAAVASGVYLLKVEHNGMARTKKMVMLK